MTLTDCPTDEELAAFVIGRVSTQSLARIEHHVESCQRCQESLAHFDVGSDDLLSQLARKSDSSNVEPIRMTERVLAIARTAIGSASVGDRPEISLHSGRY